MARATATPVPASKRIASLGTLAEKALNDSGVALPSPSSYDSCRGSLLRIWRTKLDKDGKEHNAMAARPVPTPVTRDSWCMLERNKLRIAEVKLGA
jgi:hypothetical protein